MSWLPPPTISFPPRDAEVLAAQVTWALAQVGLIVWLVRRRKARTSRPAVAVARALAIALVCLVVVEVALQVQARGRPQGAYLHRSGLFWSLRPNLRGFDVRAGSRATIIDTNAQGLRNPDLPLQKPPGELRVVCLGDSWMFGPQMEDGETFARQLEKRLAATRPGRVVHVINAGVPGYSYLQGCQMLEDVALAYQPDLVLSCGFNDRSNAAIPSQELWMSGTPMSAAHGLLSRSITYQVIRKELSRFWPVEQARGDAVVHDASLRYADRMAAILAERNIRGMFFAHLSYRDDAPNGQDVVVPSMDEVLSRMRPQPGVIACDVTFEGWRRSHDPYWLPTDDAHLNADAYANWARVVADYIDRNKLLP